MEGVAMSIGLLGLLDDIAAIAKVAAASLDDVAAQKLRLQTNALQAAHRHIGAMDVGAVKAPTIQRSEPCRR
jgi:predicted DNA repair protein MutK